MKEEERDAAVDEHLRALDAELARLRQLGAAMDRRIEEAERERQALEDRAGGTGE